jgi:Holliday junction resolvase RusA-like endonuclease
MRKTSSGSGLVLYIPGRFPGLNEVTDANRRNRYAGATQKRAATLAVQHAAAGCPRLGGRYVWMFTWFCTDKRRDPDNIASACKFVFDGLQAAGVLDNDGWAQVAEIHHRFELAEAAGVAVCATEVCPPLVREYRRSLGNSLNFHKF